LTVASEKVNIGVDDNSLV